MNAYLFMIVKSSSIALYWRFSTLSQAENFYSYLPNNLVFTIMTARPRLQSKTDQIDIGAWSSISNELISVADGSGPAAAAIAGPNFRLIMKNGL